MLDRLDRPPATAEPDESWLDGLDEALAESRPANAGALELRVVDELSYDHVAVELATTPGAARVRVAPRSPYVETGSTNGEQEAL